MAPLFFAILTFSPVGRYFRIILVGAPVTGSINCTFDECMARSTSTLRPGIPLSLSPLMLRVDMFTPSTITRSLSLKTVLTIPEAQDKCKWQILIHTTSIISIAPLKRNKPAFRRTLLSALRMISNHLYFVPSEDIPFRFLRRFSKLRLGFVKFPQTLDNPLQPSS